MKKTKLISWIAFSILILGLISWSISPKAKTGVHASPLTVSTIQVKMQPMPLLWQTTGTVEAEQTVNVTPQVTATIASIDIDEGSAVKKGQILMHLDPRTFQLNLEVSKATLSQEEAKLMSLQKDLKRYKILADSGVIAQQQYDQQLSAKLAEDDQVKADKSQVAQAQLQLNYTQITAPIEGKTGAINVHVGDLVTANTTSLLTINQLNTINVAFSIPQNNFGTLMEYQNKKSIQVTVTDSAKNTLSSNKLSFIDNAVDASTGTVLLKADFDNMAEAFWPGETVAVKIILAIEEKALVLPTHVIQMDQQGAFVYLFQNNKAVLQKVKVAREVGDLSVMAEGVAADQVVISDIPPNLKDGSMVKVV